VTPINIEAVKFKEFEFWDGVVKNRIREEGK
jgi:hypothetical protein